MAGVLPPKPAQTTTGGVVTKRSYLGVGRTEPGRHGHVLLMQRVFLSLQPEVNPTERAFAEIRSCVEGRVSPVVESKQDLVME